MDMLIANLSKNLWVHAKGALLIFLTIAINIGYLYTRSCYPHLFPSRQSILKFIQTALSIVLKKYWLKPLLLRLDHSKTHIIHSGILDEHQAQLHETLYNLNLQMVLPHDYFIGYKLKGAAWPHLLKAVWIIWIGVWSLNLINFI